LVQFLLRHCRNDLRRRGSPSLVALQGCPLLPRVGVMPAILTFGDRIERRQHTWWHSRPWPPYASLHRFIDRVRLRSCHTPLAEWACCEHWQRCLLNKWNSREFATLHGVSVPTFYWAGRDAVRMPIEDFPEHFVIRPAWGAGTRGTFVISGTTDLVTGTTYGNRQELKTRVIASRGRWGLFPLLVEEFLTTPEGRHESGVEFKFFMFGHHLGTIMTFHRRGGTKWLRYYTPDWKPINEVFQPRFPLDTPIARPHNIGEMIRIARTLGAAFGTFARVDLYSTSSGVYFGEFSSVPGIGKFTPFANEYLGRLWQEHIPDRV
jgi:hypothetical protein